MVFAVEWVRCSARPLAGFVFGSLSIHCEALFDRSHIRLKLRRVKSCALHTSSCDFCQQPCACTHRHMVSAGDVLRVES